MFWDVGLVCVGDHSGSRRGTRDGGHGDGRIVGFAGVRARDDGGGEARDDARGDARDDPGGDASEGAGSGDVKRRIMTERQILLPFR